VSAEKFKNARVAAEGRLNWRLKLTMRPAVLLVEESTQPGIQTQLAWSSLMVYGVVN
jgi:hypothetical protein